MDDDDDDGKSNLKRMRFVISLVGMMNTFIAVWPNAHERSLWSGRSGLAAISPTLINFGMKLKIHRFLYSRRL